MGALAFVGWDYDTLVPFLWDCLHLPYGAEEVSQIMHGFVTGVVNILWIYATNAWGWQRTNLGDCQTSLETNSSTDRSDVEMTIGR